MFIRSVCQQILISKQPIHTLKFVVCFTIFILLNSLYVLQSPDTVFFPKVVGVSFSSLTDDEVKRISVKQIRDPLSFDLELGHPIRGGVYDPALGPIDNKEKCETCGLLGSHCPGHLGHIELPLHVYHPMYFQRMFQLLRGICFNCHKLLASQNDIHLLRSQHLLLDEKLVITAAEMAEVVDSMQSSEAHDAIDAIVSTSLKATQSRKSKAQKRAIFSQRNLHTLKYRNNINEEFLSKCVKASRCPVFINYCH